jgi:hypothetical protein
MERDRLARMQQVMSFLLLVWYVWIMVPEHKRQLLRLALWHRVRVVSWRVARVMGHSGMTAELRGQGERYGLSLTLSTVATTAEQRYEKVRDGL